MDNRILNINGPLHDPITAQDLEKLTQALRLAFIQNSYRELWDRDADHDGDNGKGWRIFVEDWGHVEGNSCVICAIKPCFMWYWK